MRKSDKYRTTKTGPVDIDLSGPDGNAFALLGYAKSLSKQLDKVFKPIQTKMMSGDYENLIKVFKEEFGEFVNVHY